MYVNAVYVPIPNFSACVTATCRRGHVSGSAASGEVLIDHSLLNTDLTSRLINGDWARREVGADQCRRYGLHEGLCAACCRRSTRPDASGRRNCNEDLRWDRPELNCEPQQARGILAIFNWTRQACPVRAKAALFA
jgi:hypothetical protein